MKYFIILVLIIKVGVGTAQDLLVSTTQPNFNTPHANIPYAGQESSLWIRGGLYCQSVADVISEHQGNVMNVFLIIGLPTPCAPPPPGIFEVYEEVTGINALPVGEYSVNLYRLPYGVTYPPSDQDLPGYLESQVQFEVLRAVTVDATSQWNLLLFTLLILFATGYFIKRIKL